MEKKQICGGPIYDRLPPLSSNYPWLVAQTFDEKDDEDEEKEEYEDEEDDEEEEEEDAIDQTFYTINDPMSHYRCRIPELVGRHIRGCFHGWVVLSDGDKWSLWNPITSKFICLPRLILKDGDSDDIDDCCLSSPPDDHDSILLLTSDTKPNFVFCRLDRKRKKLKWIEMSYSKQLRNITDKENEFLYLPTCCNGKVYALTTGSSHVIQLHIVVTEKEVVISLLPFVSIPDFYLAGHCERRFLKGSCDELFIIGVGFTDITKNKLVDVCLYKLDMTSMAWTEMNELKGTVFFLDMDFNHSVTCSPALASELGGYIHILHKTSEVIYSYDVKDKSISMSSMHCLNLPPRSGYLRTSHISVWTMPEFRLKGDAIQDERKKDEMVRSCKNDEVEFNSKTYEAQLLNIPFHVLEMVMEFCVGVEYLNFRATCKLCRLAAPMIQWSNEKARKRLQTYSLSSPWLMAFEADRGVITFTDPISGDKYFIKVSQELLFEKRILCSKYGWLLLFTGLQRIVFFNPFTSDTRELPRVHGVDKFNFSAPPTSPDCMVVGFSNLEGSLYLHSVGRERSWRIIRLDYGGADYPYSEFPFEFPVFWGRDVYALTKEGGLQAFKGGNPSLETVVAEAPTSCCRTWEEYYLVKCDEHLLLVIVGDFGESVEVFKLKDDSSTKEWEKMNCLGRYMIYICDSTCLCMDAKTPEMENKIYFQSLHSKNGKIVFYSLETSKYHTFNGKNVEENLMDVFETKQYLYPQAWIEPSWSLLS